MIEPLEALHLGDVTDALVIDELRAPDTRGEMATVLDQHERVRVAVNHERRRLNLAEAALPTSCARHALSCLYQP